MHAEHADGMDDKPLAARLVSNVIMARMRLGFL
jgi:hypothetical protein